MKYLSTQEAIFQEEEVFKMLNTPVLQKQKKKEMKREKKNSRGFKVKKVKFANSDTNSKQFKQYKYGKHKNQKLDINEKTRVEDLYLKTS